MKRRRPVFRTLMPVIPSAFPSLNNETDDVRSTLLNSTDEASPTAPTVDSPVDKSIAVNPVLEEGPTLEQGNEIEEDDDGTYEEQAVDKVVSEFIRAQSAPDQMSAEEKENQILELRRRDEESLPCTYSRKCAVCATESPVYRATLTECGHVLCLSCVLEMDHKGRLLCPFCRKSTGFVKLHEEKGDDEPMLSGNRCFFPLFHQHSRAAAVLHPRFLARLINAVPLSRFILPNISPSATRITTCRATVPTSATSPPQTTPSDLVKLFSKAGKVVSIHAPLSNGRPLGFAYCQFKNEKDSRKAMSKLHAHTLAGHVLSVRVA
ncbi:hypothetical protein PRIPAC_75737 [Pristionchus pacificus]|uniref:RNA binding protein n=1 Tax=Pristionchus pacificus TaxID=54126 RepID=A0A2A6C6Y1_PRIPA|nr:hypothetical protein PRIPAC_75737 [Pristionchus pacificus]|eukprot:PDM73945.1 RNA binding protein [Pristionchus pacificus]